MTRNNTSPHSRRTTVRESQVDRHRGGHDRYPSRRLRPATLRKTTQESSATETHSNNPRQVPSAVEQVSAQYLADGSPPSIRPASLPVVPGGVVAHLFRLADEPSVRGESVNHRTIIKPWQFAIAAAGLLLVACGTSAVPANSSVIVVGIPTASTTSSETAPPSTVTTTSQASATTTTQTPATTTTQTPATTTTQTPATTGPTDQSGPISEASFTMQANALCRMTSAQVPEVTDPMDLHAIANTLQAVLSVYPDFLTAVLDLIARQPNQADLSSNWLSPIQDDWQASQGLAEQLVQAVQAGNNNQAGQLLDRISAAPDHRSQVTTYLNAIGLGDCASFEQK